MRIITFLICFLGSIYGLNAQTLKGKVTNEDNQGVAGASLQLIHPGTSEILQHLSSDAKGNFEFDLPQRDSLAIQVSHLQYVSYQEQFAIRDLPKFLTIELKVNSEELAAITVTGKQAQIVRKVDRLVFQVENSNISSLNGWDILRRTPMVNIRGAELSIRGSNQIVILINEKRQIMEAEELKNLLESTAGTEISSIEVISNPPAKYEASGSAVINIKMKVEKLDGYKGSVYAKYEQSNYGKQLFGLTQNYKNNHWNMRGSYYFGRGTYARYGTDVVSYPNDRTRWESTLTRVDQSNNQQSYNINAVYTLDSTLNLTLGFDGSYQPHSNGLYKVPTLIYNQQQQVESSYLTYNDHNRLSKSNNLSFLLNKQFSTNLSLAWSSYYSNSIRDQYQHILTELAFKDQPKEHSQFITQNDYDTQLASTQVDFGSKHKSIEFEFGSKYSYVKSKNRMDFQDDEDGYLAYRPEKSSNFDYREQNIAAYLSGNYSFRQWQWKAGLRAEYTLLQGEVSMPKDLNKTNYLTLFPTFYMQYQADNQAQWGFSYGKRISRPSYSWLNPAKSYYNQFSYFHGDPRLRATLSHNFDLSYTHKNWVIDLFYNYERWPNMEISYQNNETNELIYHYTNIKNGQSAGLSLIKSLDLTDFWRFQGDLTGFYNINSFMGVEQKLYQNKVYTLNSQLSSTLTLDKKSNWYLELSHRYYSPSIQGTFDISQYSSLDLNMTRKFWNNKLEASLFFLDILKTNHMKIWTKYGDQDNYFTDYQDTRKFIITLRFNFGNQGIKNSKSIERTEEQNRL